MEIIVEHSGAQVAALDKAVRRLANFAEDTELDDRFSAELMLRSGIPENVVVALQGVSRSFRAWGSRATVTRPLADGETLKMYGRKLEVLHRPGHSPSDTVFWDADRRILLAADHLIAHISSNPLITRPLDGSAERTQALVSYRESLLETRAMPAEIILPGHGEPVTDHVALIDERMRMHDRRARKIGRLLESGPRTAYEIATEMWGSVAVTQAYLTLSEVLGHVDVLLNDGIVVEQPSDDGVVRFAAV